MTGGPLNSTRDQAETPEVIRVLMIACEWPTEEVPGLSPFIKRQAEFLQAAGVDVDVFRFRGHKSPVKYLKAWRDVRRRLAAGRYDLIHAQFGQSGLLALPKRLPLVVTFRGGDLLGVVGDNHGRFTVAGKVLQYAARFVARRADAAILVSRHMQPHLKTDVPTHVIPSGLNMELFRCLPRSEARKQLGLPPDERLVLFAGNPAELRKRYALAERAVGLLNRKLTARLMVAWNVSHDEMPVYMNACDALVFTSMLEGSPNVVKEALACNLPVVSVPVGDVPERLRDAEGCELCGDERPETIAAALERVLSRGGRADNRDLVMPLEEKRLTQKVIDVYRSVLNRRGVRFANTELSAT